MTGQQAIRIQSVTLSCLCCTHVAKLNIVADVSANLKNAVPKAAAQKVLQTLSGELSPIVIVHVRADIADK